MAKRPSADVETASYDHSRNQRKPPKELHRIEANKGENGGVVMRHSFTSMEHEPEEHVFGASEGRAAVAHFAQHMGLPKPSFDGGKEEEQDTSGDEE